MFTFSEKWGARPSQEVRGEQNRRLSRIGVNTSFIQAISLEKTKPVYTENYLFQELM